MKFILPILFACIAATGNALFAYGQRQSSTVGNGLLFVGASALVACLCALLASPIFGSVSIENIRHNIGVILVSGFGLFLTYVGFNLLYANFGVSSYILYAVISIITTTVVVGFFLLKESVNTYHIAAVVAATITVVLFSIGQSKV